MKKQLNIFISLVVTLANFSLLKVLVLVLVFNYCSASSYGALDIQAIGPAESWGTMLISSVGFIPWHNTQSLNKGTAALNRMYDSLPSGSTLKSFLDKHYTHLLKSIDGNTNIPTSYADPSVLNSLPNVVNPDKAYNPSQYEGLDSQVGVYVFFRQGESKAVQCGSSIAFSNRIRSYYYESNKREFIFNGCPIHNYKWVPIVFNKDYVGMFNSISVMTPAEEHILKSFMQQEIRSLEQAYSMFAEPSNYKFIQVSTWHNKWKEGDIGQQFKRITWITEDGKVHTRDTTLAGVLALGFDYKHVVKTASLEGATLDTKKYGKVTISIEGVNKSDTFHKRYGTPANTFVDTSTFKPNYLYLFGQDMNPLSLEPYNSAREANLGMGLPEKYGGTHLWTNYIHLINAPALDMFVYVVKAGQQSIPVIVESVKDDSITEYSSIASALKAIAPGAKNDKNLLRTIMRGKAFSYKGGDAYYIRYKYQQDHNIAMTRYLAFGYKL